MAVAVFSIAACSPSADAAGCFIATQQQSVVGGGPAPASDGITQSMQLGIGRLRPTKGSTLCSAVAIGRRTLLSAAHCVPEAEVFELLNMRDEVVRTVLVQSVTLHVERDVMLVRLLEPLPVESAAVPLAPRAVSMADRGCSGEISGIGVTESFTPKGRRFLEVSIVHADDHVITVEGRDGTGACRGDSGGPLFITVAGSVVLAGVLSVGSTGCVGRDIYEQVAPLAAWIEENSSD